MSLCIGVFLSLLSTSGAFQNNRHVCFFKEYSFVRGPHFNALFDQLVEQTGFDEKRVAFLSTIDHDTNAQLKEDLGLQKLETFRLDKMKPLEMEDKILAFDPTILWVGDGPSALQLRYSMRTSGLDGIVERLCGSIDEKSLLFVGEGAGVICGGSNMALAKGQDPAPEPQFRGLDLLGSSMSVCFNENAETTSTTVVGEKKVFVFSQQDGDAMSFVMSPTQKGAIEGLSHPEPVPPLEENIGGRKCTGEPAVDPSRMLQMEGDSEWFEGEV